MKKDSLRSRIVHGLSATAMAPFVTAAIQFSTVPVFLHAWGAARLGDWLVLSAVPGYLSLCDLGFGNAAGSDMTVRVAAGDHDGALETFQSSWVLLTAISGIVLLMLAATVWFAPWRAWFHLSGMTDHGAAAVIVALGAWVLIWQQSSFFESCFRCDGHFALGTWCGSAVRLFEAFVAIVIALSGGSFPAVALGYLVARTMGSVVFAFLLHRMSPWIRVGVRRARWEPIRRLAAPAFGFVVLPLAQALSVQGATIIVGATAGPIAVTVFSTIRTLTRLNFQAVNAVARVLWPELSSAFGAGNIGLARSLHRRASQVSLVLSFVTAAALWLAGPVLYRVWLHGGAAFDASLFHILLGVSVAGSFWYLSAVVPMSSNMHQKIANAYFGATCASLAIAWAATARFGIEGTAWSLLVAELAMLWIVPRGALRQVDDSPVRFAAAIFSGIPRSSWHRVAHEGADSL